MSWIESYKLNPPKIKMFSIMWRGTVPHLSALCPMLWQLRVEYFDTHYTTVTDIVDIYDLNGEKDHWLREQNKSSGVLRH